MNPWESFCEIPGARAHLNLRIWNWEFRKTKLDRIWRQSIRDERSTERERTPEICRGSSSKIQLSTDQHISVSKLPGPGREPVDRGRQNSPCSSHGARNSLRSHQSVWRELLTQQALNRAQWWNQSNCRPTTALGSLTSLKTSLEQIKLLPSYLHIFQKKPEHI